jgi:hypothetical protein
MPAGLYHDPGGKPGLRDWTGTEWSPYLHVDPASGKPAGEDGTAKVWSPLPEPDQQRHRDHIASRARRAGIWLAVCLVLTAVAMAVGLALYVHDPGKAIAWACGVAACGLVFIGWAWTAVASRRLIRPVKRRPSLPIRGTARPALSIAGAKQMCKASNGTMHQRPAPYHQRSTLYPMPPAPSAL